MTFLSKIILTALSTLVLCYSMVHGQEQITLRYEIPWKQGSSDGLITKIMQNGVPDPSAEGLDMFYTQSDFGRRNVVRSSLRATQTVASSLPESMTVNLGQDFTYDLTVSEVRGKYDLFLTVRPFRKHKGAIERLISFEIDITYETSFTVGRGPTGTMNSVLSNGDIYKISIPKTGVYRMDRNFLETKLGIDVSKIDPDAIRIYGNRGGRIPEKNSAVRTDDLEQLSITVTGSEDGKFDTGDNILFYAEGPDVWKYDPVSKKYSYDKNIYDNNNYCFIKIGGEDGKRITKQSTQLPDAEITVSVYDMLQRVEDDKVNLLGAFSGAEGTGKDWYGDIFNSGAREKDMSGRFDFSGFDPQSPMSVDLVFAGRSSSPQTLTLKTGSKTISKNITQVSVLNAESLYARRVILSETFAIPDNNPSVVLSYQASAGDAEGWLDYLQIAHSRKLLLDKSQLAFRSRATIGAGVAAFKPENLSGQIIWDVTDPSNPKEIVPVNSSIIFSPEGQLHEFISFGGVSSAFEPVALGKLANQNLHGMETEAMIIVYHPQFKEEALKLAAHRSQVSGFKVLAASTDQVYNEFSSGRVDPGAIRDMARLLYERNPAFRYLLLFGDGSYDYKGLVRDLPAENFVPVYETDESLDPIDGFPSDDFYGLLGPEEGENLKGGLDIYVGRLPAKSAEEAMILVNKIIHYETDPGSFGDWRVRSGYVADDEDSNTHLRDMDEIARSDEQRHPIQNQQKVYADAYTQVSTPGENRFPDANKSINDNIFKGQLSLTYLGHGGPLGWAQERILTVPDIQSWTNINSLSILVTATCSFGAYDDPAVVTPAEFAILNPKGGAIAMLTTTRAVYTNSNKLLTDAAHELMFKKTEGGVAPAIGYVLGAGKNKYQGESFRVNSRKFTLLGDPSMPVALPRYNIVVTSVNGKDVTASQDTLQALEKVTIQGYIADLSGKELNTFNGTIYPTVFDKKSTLTTLGNDAGSPKFTFTAYKNILFKGAATVSSGKWTFSFWVPKNINYNYGSGRLSLYADNGTNMDAGGVFNNFVVGGSAGGGITDDQGPNLDIYMNDESFVSGGMTGSNPVLLLNLTDDFGINVTGSAIGQDITAILDGDNQNTFILNDFYEAKKDNYTSGTVRFPLKGLAKGSHHIVAKCWDIAGNSTEKRIDFTVAEDGETKLTRVYNYPNPFTRSTSFMFEHDLTNTEIDIVVDIYSISGKLIKSITDKRFVTGFRVNDLTWDGKDDLGSGLAKGVYLYKVRIHARDLNLSRESGFEKLVKL